MSAIPTASGDSTQQPEDLPNLLVAAAFGPDATITATADVGEGRGVFSTVLRLSIEGLDTPTSAVAKLPVGGPNGQAAIASGAIQRERLAYESLLPIDGLRTPLAYASVPLEDGSAAFLLEDLTTARRVDQLDGLDLDDTLAVVEGLATLHRHFDEVAPPPVRANTPATFPAAALDAGLVALRDRWAIDPERIEVFATLVANRSALVERFISLRPTLCHGDPRADNLVFDDDGSVVLFDWQQLAVQAGEADLAWLLATSLATPTREAATPEVIRHYASRRGVSADDTTEALTTGFLLPGLAVLFLAQRASDSTRTDAFIRTSIDRIADAVGGLVATVE